MRESRVPAVVDPDPDDNLPALVVANAAEAPDAVLFGRRGGGGGRWEDVTAAQFLAEVTGVAKGLVDAGVGPGDRVGLLSRTRYEWTLVDVAIWFAGAVTVPIYETSSPEQVRWILQDSGAQACVVESAAHEATVTGLREHLPELREVWTLDGGAVEHLTARGLPVDDDQLAARREDLRADSVATLIYTSGTTGRPKGCELTHGNFLHLARNTVGVLGDVVNDRSSTLLFLPLAHVFARFVQVLALTGRSRLGHTPDVKNLLPDLQSFGPTYLLAVPRVFEKIYNSAEAGAQAGGKAKGAVFTLAADVAVAWSEQQAAGRRPGPRLRLLHALCDRLVYARLRAATGGRLQYAVSGGAPLGRRLGHFFRGAGITVLEGWGLTETTAPATVNQPADVRIGTVGRPLPGVAVAVAEDGELLVSGVNVMRGYHDNPEATAEAVRDGWFATGDLGEIDADGFVSITGRKKELIVTAGGKNVQPTMLEDRIRANPLISQVMVVGDQKPFIGALVTLDEEMLPGWLSTRGRPALDLAAARTDPDVLAEVQRAVDDANTLVSKAESIRKFVILDRDLTEAGGQLTPKLSVKRQVVLKDFAGAMDELYG